jgi:hypothetical protein
MTSMRARSLSAVVVVCLTVGACGDDEPSVQDRVADATISKFRQQMRDEGLPGVTIDDECVHDIMDGVSDAEAEELLAETFATGSTLHEDENTVETRFIDCVDFDLTSD